MVLLDPAGLLLRGQERRGRAPTVRLPEQRLRPGPGRIVLSPSLPEGYKVNPLASSRLTWRETPAEIRLDATEGAIPVTADELPLALPATFSAGRATFRATVALYYCADERESVCRIYYAQIEAPVWITPEAGNTILRLDVAVTLPGDPPSHPPEHRPGRA